MPERKPALDHEARVFLARRLRAYYDNIRNTPVSEALSNILKEIEQKTDQERRTSVICLSARPPIAATLRAIPCKSPSKARTVW